MPMPRRMNNKQRFGARLTNARKAAGMTLDELGARLGISAQAVQQWEKGNAEPSVTRIGVVAAILNCNVAWLITGHGDVEHAQSLNLTLTGKLGGQLVAQIDVADAVAFVEGRVSPKNHVYTVFPCSDLSFQVLLKDDSNAPDYIKGDAVVIDPAIKPRPGDMVLAVLEGEAEPIFRRYRLVKGPTSPKMILEPLNPHWDEKEGSENGITVLGVKTEHTRPRG